MKIGNALISYNFRYCLWWVLIPIFTFSACYDSEPEDECDEFTRVLCERIVECNLDDVTVNQCTIESAFLLDCDRVTDVSPDFPDCIRALESISCQDFNADETDPLPDVCKGILEVE